VESLRRCACVCVWGPPTIAPRPSPAHHHTRVLESKPWTLGDLGVGRGGVYCEVGDGGRFSSAGAPPIERARALAAHDKAWVKTVLRMEEDNAKAAQVRGRWMPLHCPLPPTPTNDRCSGRTLC
jgi:hypothetical protein